jgi:hypothetical protein
LESNETAQFVKDGVSVFENNSVGTFNPTFERLGKSIVKVSVAPAFTTKPP